MSPPSPSALRLAVVLALAAAVACVPEPEPLPTEAEIARLDRASQPPLYQLLYDAPTLPADQPLQQRVRMLIWLRRMALSEAQLDQLAALTRATAERREQIAAAEREAHRRWREATTPLYAEIEALLLSGVAQDDPRLIDLAARLAEQQAALTPEAELLRLRTEGIHAILDAEGEFLRTLSPDQEALLVDSLFFLRGQLDPVGNPGDFRALVGTTYEPGQYAVLTRGTGTGTGADPRALDIGGLWSDDPTLTGLVLHEARREALLYLALLDPALGEAIALLRQPPAPPPP